MITECGIRQLKKYCREPIEKIKGYRDAVESEGRYECHHLNELTFTRGQLKKMNMYYNRPASELIIMSDSEHEKWHIKWNGHPMRGRTGALSPMFGRTGAKHPRFGKKHTDETRKKMRESSQHLSGDKHPMYGRSFDKSPTWKGDEAGPSGMYKRARKLYNEGKISEEEFQKFRDAKTEYVKMMRMKKCVL